MRKIILRFVRLFSLKHDHDDHMTANTAFEHDEINSTDFFFFFLFFFSPMETLIAFSYKTITFFFFFFTKRSGLSIASNVARRKIDAPSSRHPSIANIFAESWHFPIVFPYLSLLYLTSGKLDRPSNERNKNSVRQGKKLKFYGQRS